MEAQRRQRVFGENGNPNSHERPANSGRSFGERTQSQPSMDYITRTVDQAFTTVSIKSKSCPPGEVLTAVVRTCIHREPEPQEMTALTNECQRLQAEENRAHRWRIHPPHRRGRALGVADPPAGHRPHPRSPRPRLRARPRRRHSPSGARTDGAELRARLQLREQRGLSSRDRRARTLDRRARHAAALSGGRRRGFVCADLLLLCAMAGLAGSCRLISDLKADDDGRETTAQRILEAYFWVASLVGLVLGSLAIARRSSCRRMRLTLKTASTSPDAFKETAARLGIDSSFGSDAVDAVSRTATVFKWAATTLSLILLCVLLVACAAAARIVTTFELLQGLLHNLGILSLIVSAGLIYLSVVGQFALSFRLIASATRRRPLPQSFLVAVAVAVTAWAMLRAVSVSCSALRPLSARSSSPPPCSASARRTSNQRGSSGCLKLVGVMHACLLLLVTALGITVSTWDGIGLYVSGHCKRCSSLAIRDGLRASRRASRAPNTMD